MRLAFGIGCMMVAIVVASMTSMGGCAPAPAAQITVTLALGAAQIDAGATTTATATVNEDGAPKSDAQVAFTVTTHTGGATATLSAATQTTGANGQAQVVVTAGTTEGSVTVSAAHGGVTGSQTLTIGAAPVEWTGVTDQPFASTQSSALNAGGSGFTVQASQTSLGNPDGGCNPDGGAGNNGSGAAMFRIIRRAAADSRATVSTYGRIHVWRPASVRDGTGLDITNSGNPSDPGPEPPDAGVPHAICTLQGVIHVPSSDNPNSDPQPPPVDTPTPEAGPIGNLNGVIGTPVVADENGDVTLPPLPELPADWEYGCEVTGPPGSSFTPITVGIPTLTGVVTVCGDYTPPWAEVYYDITDYFPLQTGLFWAYSELPNDLGEYGDPEGTIWRLESRDALQNELPALGSFVSSPMQKWRWLPDDATPGEPGTALDSAFDWWTAEPGDTGGLAWYAGADLFSADPNRDGDGSDSDWDPVNNWWTTDVLHLDTRLIFPNHLLVGVPVMSDAPLNWMREIGVGISTEDTTTGYGQFQILSAGDEVVVPAGTFSDTLTVQWFLPYNDPALPADWGPLVIIRKAALAKDENGAIGVLWEKQFLASADMPDNNVLMYWAELTDWGNSLVNPTNPGDLTVNILSRLGPRPR